jgi:hypothetical protein
LKDDKINNDDINQTKIDSSAVQLENLSNSNKILDSERSKLVSSLD